MTPTGRDERSPGGGTDGPAGSFAVCSDVAEALEWSARGIPVVLVLPEGGLRPAERRARIAVMIGDGDDDEVLRLASTMGAELFGGAGPGR